MRAGRKKKKNGVQPTNLDTQRKIEYKGVTEKKNGKEKTKGKKRLVSATEENVENKATPGEGVGTE